MRASSLATALLVLAVSAGVTRSQNWDVITDDLKNTVVIVERHSNAGGKWLQRGSGFVIGESGYVLTAKHVIDGFDDATQQLSSAT